MNLADLLPKLDFEDPWAVTLGPSLITMSDENSVFEAKKDDVFAVGESAQKFPELLAGCTSSMVFLFCKRIISSAKRVSSMFGIVPVLFIKSLSVPFNCHFLFRILCRDAIMAPPKKKRKTTDSTTTDIPVPVSRPNIGMLESVDGVVLGLSETVAGLRWYIDLVDHGVRGLDTGTGMSVVVDSVVFLFFFGGIIRLQNRNTMEEVQPASSSGNFCADSHTANTSSFLASNTEFSSGQLRSIVPVLFSANIGMMESVDGVVLGLSETVAGLRWYIDLVDRGVRGLDTGTGMSVVVDSVVLNYC
jgi:hypothetical protein